MRRDSANARSSSAGSPAVRFRARACAAWIEAGVETVTARHVPDAGYARDRELRRRASRRRRPARRWPLPVRVPDTSLLWDATQAAHNRRAALLRILQAGGCG